MKTFLYGSIIVTVMTCVGSVFAHPVTYKDGIAAATQIRRERQDLHLNYSLTNRFAIGGAFVHIEDKSDSHAYFAIPHVNFLLQRWNLDDAQANIYLMGGLGYANYRSRSALGTLAAGQADFETRRLYTAINAQTLYATTNNFFTEITGTVGVAPYLAEFDQLSTFIIGRVKYKPYSQHTISISPGVRFFYKSFFFEAGSSIEGEWFVNLMYHF